MNNTINMPVKFALLLSLLGSNISLSYASTTSLPTYDEIVKDFDKIKAEKKKAFDEADAIVEKYKKYNSDTRERLEKETNLNQITKDLLSDITAEKETMLNDNENRVASIENDADNNQKQFNINNKKLIDTKANFESIYNAGNSTINDNSKSIANNKEIINGLQKQFTTLKNEFEEYKTATNGAIAGVAAMGMLTTPQGIGHTAISAGAGYYGGESAIAVGVTHNIDALTIRAGASYSTGSSQPVLGAGVGYEF